MTVLEHLGPADVARAIESHPRLTRAVRDIARETGLHEDVVRSHLNDALTETLERLGETYVKEMGDKIAAVDQLREDGVRAGALELMTLWPFPETLVEEAIRDADAIVVPELNLGQVALMVRAVSGAKPVVPLGRMDGSLLRPTEIAAAGREALNGGGSKR